MAVKCAKRLWSRSIEKHQFRYINALSGEDSKAYDATRSLEPYGKEKAIIKEDCINHVAKRMGTTLRNFVAASKVMKQTNCKRRKIDTAEDSKNSKLLWQGNKR